MRPEQLNQTAKCELNHWWFAARREILRAVAKSIPGMGVDSLVIDVGCCTGANAAALAKDYSVVGVDPSETAIELARRRFPDISFLRGTAPEDLGELAGRADLFLLADVLEHVADDHGLLANLADCAAPGSHFLITVPALPALWSPHDESHGHYRRYTRASFAHTWMGLPLTAVGISSFNSRLYPLVRIARLIARFRGRAWGAHNTDLVIPPNWLNALLRCIFAGETARVVRAARGEQRAGYRYGVSLLAVLKRMEGSTKGCAESEKARSRPCAVGVDSGSNESHE